MNYTQSLRVTLAALLLAGCSTVTVTTDYDRSANFGALRTYAWRPGPQQGLDDPRFDRGFLDARVHAAVDRVLAARGHQQATPGTAPDFLVGYHAVVRQKTSVQTINSWYGYRVGGWAAYPATHTYDYDEGTLLIDVIEPTTMKLLWRGVGKGVVDASASAEKRERRINDAVDKILADFPPR